jgi:hypothetical protein
MAHYFAQTGVKGLTTGTLLGLCSVYTLARVGVFGERVIDTHSLSKDDEVVVDRGLLYDICKINDRTERSMVPFRVVNDCGKDKVCDDQTLEFVGDPCSNAK